MNRHIPLPFIILIFSCCQIPLQSIAQEEESQDTIRKIILNNIPPGGGFVVASQEPTPLNIDSVAQVIGYPAKAVRRNIQGQVIVRILVDESGQYIRHKFIREVHPILVAAIEPELPTLRFSPALDVDGNPLKFWVNIPFNFSLR